MKIFNKRTGFTLAELLLTISIVGVLAALTIPTLSSRIGDRENITRFKATYTRLVSALEMASIDKSYQCFRISHNDKYLSNVDESLTAEDSKASGCYDNSNETGMIYDMLKILGGEREILSGNVDPNSKIGLYKTNLLSNLGTGSDIKFLHVLKDGSYFMVPTEGANHFYIDTNGLRAPNKVGKDVFHMAFYISESKMREYADTYATVKRISPRKIEILPFAVEEDSEDDAGLEMYKRVIGVKQ